MANPDAINAQDDAKDAARAKGVNPRIEAAKANQPH